MDNVIIVAVKGIIKYKNKVLIIQRSPEDETGKNTWEFVGGKLDFGEQLEDALKREIQEEVGIRVTIEKLLYASTFQSHPYRQVVILTYLCQSDTEEVVLSSEHQAYRWADRVTMEELLHPGIINDIHKHDIYQQLNIT